MPTEFISKHSTLQAFNAFVLSEALNKPLTIFITIHWERTENHQESNIARIRESFLHSLAKWCRGHTLPCAYIWVMERGQQHGLHMHMLLHCPRRHFDELMELAPRWIIGFRANQRILDFGPDKRTRQPKFHWRLNQRIGRLRYMLKGINPDHKLTVEGKRVSLIRHLEIRSRPQGAVIGKRVGISHFLGKAVRESFTRSRTIIAQQGMRVATLLQH